jgi:hypothetical protein
MSNKLSALLGFPQLPKVAKQWRKSISSFRPLWTGKLLRKYLLIQTLLCFPKAYFNLPD